MDELSNFEKRALLALGALGGSGTPEDVQRQASLPEIVHVMNASSWLQAKGLVRHEETLRTFVRATKHGIDYRERGLPERRALDAVLASGGRASTADLVAGGTILAEEVSIAVGWLKRKGLAEIRKEGDLTVLVATDAGRRMRDGRMPDEAALAALAGEEAREEAIDADGLKLLYGRQNLVAKREEVTRVIHVTTKGRLLLERGVTVREDVSQITPDLMSSGRWRDVDLRPYDVTAFAPAATGGKKHPLRQIIDRIRQIFLEMGFTEIEGPFVRSAFWNMDVLFTPQDHPARAMQDTFYTSRPDRVDLSQEPILRTVKAVHESGGTCGSVGWRYPWSQEIASQMLLRTHTTVDTINYLRNHPEPPVKLFSVDRVFRNEAVDATHLPEFHQVEGVVMEEGANLRMLIGFLREFYRKMGFDKVTVRPSYYPYTEPSIDIAVFYNNRWLELGGAGVFRPEVMENVGLSHPVLAWGLGLERLAMMTLGLKDLRELYVSDVEWLRNAPLVE